MTLVGVQCTRGQFATMSSSLFEHPDGSDVSLRFGVELPTWDVRRPVYTTSDLREVDFETVFVQRVTIYHTLLEVANMFNDKMSVFIFEPEDWRPRRELRIEDKYRMVMWYKFRKVNAGFASSPDSLAAAGVFESLGSNIDGVVDGLYFPSKGEAILEVDIRQCFDLQMQAHLFWTDLIYGHEMRRWDDHPKIHRLYSFMVEREVLFINDNINDKAKAFYNMSKYCGVKWSHDDLRKISILEELGDME